VAGIYSAEIGWSKSTVWVMKKHLFTFCDHIANKGARLSISENLPPLLRPTFRAGRFFSVSELFLGTGLQVLLKFLFTVVVNIWEQAKKCFVILLSAHVLEIPSRRVATTRPGITRRSANASPFSPVEWNRNTDRTDPLDFLPVFEFGLQQHSVMLAGKWLDKPEMHVQEYLGPEIWSGRQVLLADNGREPSSKTLIIRNPGNQSLTISPGSVPNGFIVQDFSDSPLAPGQAKAFTVAINPAVSGYQSGAFRIMTNDGNEQLFVIPLREAAPEVDVVDVQDGGTFTFPEDAVVGDTLEYEFTIKNIGFPALEVSAPQITAPFTLVSGSFPATIRSGRPKTFTVQVDTSVADSSCKAHKQDAKHQLHYD